MNVMTDKNLLTYSAFGLDGIAKQFIHLTDTQDISEAAEYINRHGLPVFPIGEGSNTITPGCVANKCVVHVDTSGVAIARGDYSVQLQIAAGENWDRIVQLAATNGWAGITALSAIPGSVGAAPVQNIGAYGQEMSDVVNHVTVYDCKSDTKRSFDKSKCQFGYRTSVFKQHPGRFIVLSVTITLEKRKPDTPDYGSVTDVLDERNITEPTHKELRRVITDIRWSKLHRPEKTPNVGSFFTNPIITESHYERIKKADPEAPGYEQDGGIKIPAGWLVETVGMKGRQHGSVGVSGEHALVIISDDLANFSDLAELIGAIRQRVREEFGIELEREPRLLM
jgi:UDP-N-acetylmuramate dehydrogenase